MANAPKRPAPQVFDHQPQKTIAAAVKAASQHVQAVHKAAQK